MCWGLVGDPLSRIDYVVLSTTIIVDICRPNINAGLKLQTSNQVLIKLSSSPLFAKLANKIVRIPH